MWHPITIAAFLWAANVPIDSPKGQKPINPKAGCRSNPALVAACFDVDGRAFASNGTPSFRIAVTGTKRVLGVLPPEDEIVPGCLRREVTFEQEVVGRFRVCPFQPDRPGSMQMVCVDEVRSAVVHPIVRADQRRADRKIDDDCRIEGSPSSTGVAAVPQSGQATSLLPWVEKSPFERIGGRTYYQAPAIAGPLRRMVPAGVRRSLQDLIVTGPVQQQEGYLVSFGCRRHACPDENFVLAVRLDDMRLALIHWDADARQQTTCYSTGLQMRELPRFVKEEYVQGHIPRETSSTDLLTFEPGLDDVPCAPSKPLAKAPGPLPRR